VLEKVAGDPEEQVEYMKVRMESINEKIARVLKDKIAVVAYDPSWPDLFAEERIHLQSCLPAGLVKRIAHFGSTAVPDLPAKPIIDILVEVTDLDQTRKHIAPILETQGYDYFWRSSHDNGKPPHYAWFIKRDPNGNRTHHIHMVESSFEHHWDRLLFRDYLIANRETALQYGLLKQRLADKSPNDRIAYTKAKTDFIMSLTALAKQQHLQV